MTEPLWPYNTRREVPCTGDRGQRKCRHRHRRYSMGCIEWSALLGRSGGRCEICRVPASDTKHGHLVIDHDYAHGVAPRDGAVRGLLCSTCNTRIATLVGFNDTEEAKRYHSNPWHRERQALGF